MNQEKEWWKEENILTKIFLLKKKIYETNKIENNYIVFFMDLFQQHPNYKKKFKNFSHFDIREFKHSFPIKLGVYIIDKDGKEDMISMKSCIRQDRYEKIDYKYSYFTKAARLCITSQIRDYRRQNYYKKCMICFQFKSFYIIDHKIKFKDIVDRFINEYQIDVSDEEFNFDISRREYSFKNNDIKRDFYWFHFKHVVLRKICKECDDIYGGRFDF
jgi:hypothetical protein